MEPEEVAAYPLAWPETVPRHEGMRQRAAFSRKSTQIGTNGTSWSRTRDLTVADAVTRLRGELGRLGVSHFVCSTNLKVRRDGLPYSDQREPADPGVAIYFRLRKRPYCLPCDRWSRVADNIAAIAAHVSALRGIERWGVGTVEQAFTGYLALPPPGIDWRATFPEVTTVAELEAAYRERAKSLHPDVAGEHEAMVRLNQAREAGRRALGADV